MRILYSSDQKERAHRYCEEFKKSVLERNLKGLSEKTKQVDGLLALLYSDETDFQEPYAIGEAIRWAKENEIILYAFYAIIRKNTGLSPEEQDMFCQRLDKFSEGFSIEEIIEEIESIANPGVVPMETGSITEILADVAHYFIHHPNTDRLLFGKRIGAYLADTAAVINLLEKTPSNEDLAAKGFSSIARAIRLTWVLHIISDPKPEIDLSDIAEKYKSLCRLYEPTDKTDMGLCYDVLYCRTTVGEGALSLNTHVMNPGVDSLVDKNAFVVVATEEFDENCIKKLPAQIGRYNIVYKSYKQHEKDHGIMMATLYGAPFDDGNNGDDE